MIAKHLEEQASKEDFIINHSIKFQDSPVRYEHDLFKNYVFLRELKFSELAASNLAKDQR